MCSGFYQGYQWYTNIDQGSTNGTKPLVPMVMPMVPLALPLVSLATNGTIGKITNGTIGKPQTESWACYHDGVNLFQVI